MQSEREHFDPRGLLVWPGLPVWSGLLLATAVLGLLLAFHQVVQGAVDEGESRRLAAHALAAATWRCNALRGADAARQCLARLDAPADAIQVALAPRPMPTGQVRPAVLPAPALASDGAVTRRSPQSRSRNIRLATLRGLPESTE